jgi:hypothetical protein
MSVDEQVLKCPRADMNSPWKQVLDFYFKEFMEFCFPEVAAQIHWQRGYES